MRNKNGILIGLAVLIVGAVIGLAVPKHRAAATTPTPTPSASAVAPSKDIVIQAVDGQSALTAVEAQQSVEVKHYSFGDLVISINGLASTDTEGWTFYVNNVQSSVGAGDYMPKSGDKLEFRYEKF